MKKSYWLYKMCLLLGLGICIPVTGNASDIGDATLTQQQSKITASGVVVDESGESLIGASVIEKGAATNGTITDIDGRFNLEIPENATLTISYIGYLTQEIAVGNRSDLSIQLKEDSETLDEVVVIGYGTTSAKKMVSAVTAVKGEKLQDLPFPNVASTLQGRASGVIVQNQGGEPGSEPKISIRGGGDLL